MSERNEGFVDTASGPALGDRPPVDVETIRTTIRQATEPKTIPIALRIDDLVGRLRGHVGVLMLEDLGEQDRELRQLRSEARLLLQSDPAGMPSRVQRWEYVGILAASAKALLRRYEGAPVEH